MIHIDEIKIMNETTIAYLKKMGQNIERNEIINEILKDEACFFKMDKEDAIMILISIGISAEKVEQTYSDLVSSEEYYSLYQNGKIDENDENFKIKYKKYDSKDLFN